MPPSLREWLPPEHVVYFVSELVDKLDLSAILDSYEQKSGYPPYHPVLMSKLVLYGYVRGVRSSRKMQRACVEDVAFPVLCAGNQPDFRTIAAFRARHLEALGGLFVQVLALCQRAGMANLGHVAVDSTKIKANASKHKAMSYSRMQQEEKRLQEQARRMLQQSIAIDEAEDRLYGPDQRGDELPPEFANPETRLAKIMEAKAALEAEARDRAKGKDPEQAEPAAKAQRNSTDPNSRIMLSSDKAFVQAYSAQAAVDAEHQVIVAADVVQTGSDGGQLLPYR